MIWLQTHLDHYAHIRIGLPWLSEVYRYWLTSDLIVVDITSILTENKFVVHTRE